jgi:deoxyribodipyrimidine photolyase-related protein
MDLKNDTVLMVEVKAEATYVRHHSKKIVLILSAMRHFAQELKAKGGRVRYIQMDDADNTGTFAGEVHRAVHALQPSRLVTTHPGEWRVLKDMLSWQERFGLPVEIQEDDRFFCSPSQFAEHAKARKELRMEFFYREMRQRTKLLMGPDGKPVGGQWNYDKENRKPPSAGIQPPARFWVDPDPITRDVIELVARHFGDHFGKPEPFGFAVSRSDAVRALDYFIKHGLPRFGDFQDAMVTGEPLLWHSLLSPYLNIGLLEPLEVCQAAEKAYQAGLAPLNAAEGFIRQILGWREFVRGLYWLKMPDYADANFFGATRALPAFYWDPEKTEMNCIKQCVSQTRDEAYAHHIQRLMVLGNFALLAGLSPREVNEWYLIVYADAFEWVELPNVHGMVLFADGGVLASKPYAASGKYINRMSDYCKSCCYDPDVSEGPTACPFNSLYWDFLARHRDKLKANHRMKMMYATLDKMPPHRLNAMREQAKSFLAGLEPTDWSSAGGVRTS